jgi:hypothetical protein
MQVNFITIQQRSLRNVPRPIWVEADVAIHEFGGAGDFPSFVVGF